MESRELLHAEETHAIIGALFDVILSSPRTF
jgi:hypothetical protein